MIKISVVSVGKIKEKYIKLGIDEFSKRLSSYCKLEIIEVNDEKAPENLSDKEMTMVKNKEGLSILSKIRDGAYVIALAIDGKSLSSEELAEAIFFKYDLSPPAYEVNIIRADIQGL